MKKHLISFFSTRFFRVWVGIIVSVVAIYLAVKNVDFYQVGEALKNVRQDYILLAFLSIAGNNVCKSIRWKILVGDPGSNIRLGKYLSIFLIGQMLNVVFPGRIGDVGRAYVLGGLGPGRTFTLGTILVEKVIDSFSYALLFLFLIFLIPLPQWVGQSTVFFVGVILLISIIVVFLANRKSALRKLLVLTARLLPNGWRKRIIPRVDAGITSLDIIQDRTALSKIGILTTAIWGTAMLNNYLVLKAFDLDLPWVASLLVLIVLQAGISIPSIPGKFGIFEYTCILALSVFGVDQDLALSYGLVLHGLVFIPTTLAGLIVFWGMGLSGERKKFRDGMV